jgi:hypothetical protein
MVNSSWANLDSYMNKIGLLTDFLEVCFGILKIDQNNVLNLENDDEAEKQYFQAIESQLQQHEEGDLFLEAADENLQILFTLLKMNRDVIEKIDPELIGVIQNLEQRDTILELVFQQYAFRNYDPRVENRRYIAVMCEGWQVYKRYI